MPNRPSLVRFVLRRFGQPVFVGLLLMLLVVCFTGRTQAAVPSPPVVSGAAYTASGSGQITITWAASSGATSYSIYRGTSSGGESTTALSSTITTS